MNMDVHHGHGRGHAIETWTCSRDLDMQSVLDMLHGRTFSMDREMQHGHERQHEDEHAAWCPFHVHVNARLSGIWSVPYWNEKKKKKNNVGTGPVPD